MSLQTKMSLVGNAELEDKSRRYKEERNEEIQAHDDDLNAHNSDHPFPLMNDTNLEERVAALEFQMANVQEDVVVLDVGLLDLAEDVEAQITIIEADITFIQADQTTQDQRLFDVEEEVETVEDDVIELDSRVTALEELNVTVEALEADS